MFFWDFCYGQPCRPVSLRRKPASGRGPCMILEAGATGSLVARRWLGLIDEAGEIKQDFILHSLLRKLGHEEGTYSHLVYSVLTCVMAKSFLFTTKKIKYRSGKHNIKTGVRSDKNQHATEQFFGPYPYNNNNNYNGNSRFILFSRPSKKTKDTIIGYYSMHACVLDLPSELDASQRRYK
jgi:hypothetical protein